MGPRALSRFFAAIPGLALAGAGHASSPAATVQRYLDGLGSFEAQFTQHVTDSRGRTVEEASGRLYLQKPGRFRWDYLQPTRQQIVSDGRNLWHYDEDLEQVMVKAIDESLATTPGLLLTGQIGVAESYEVGEGGERDGLEWLRLVPRRDDTDFIELELGFREGELKAMELQDKLGQRTRIAFSGVRRNPRLAASLFEFRAPAGVDVIGKAR